MFFLIEENNVWLFRARNNGNVVDTCIYLSLVLTDCKLFLNNKSFKFGS